jgi:hypothetical protein
MKRNFPNFLEAWQEYAEDGFSPPQFNTWAGLSIIAGALERRVWLPWNDTYSFYPNIYVLLISKPGAGKSVSLNKAVELLTEMNAKKPVLNIMPSQVTEAKFIELMGQGRSFTYRDAVSGKESVIFQNAGYYFASEASNSLRDIFGSFLACLTDFYDCPPTWARATKKDGKPIRLKNVCMNMIAGSTFDYLGKLVNDENVQGGFASRILYIVHKDKIVRNQPFQMGLNDVHRNIRHSYREALLHDLGMIAQLVGPMYADDAFGAAWEQWYPAFEAERQGYQSEKLQSILARTNTNVLKVAMLLCAAETDDMQLKLRHFEKSLQLVMGVNSQIPEIFMESKAAQGTRGGGTALTNMILMTAKRMELPTIDDLVSSVVLTGAERRATESSVMALIQQKALALSDDRRLTVLANADAYI